jgi:hypothetical protein
MQVGDLVRFSGEMHSHLPYSVYGIIVSLERPRANQHKPPIWRVLWQNFDQGTQLESEDYLEVIDEKRNG